MEIFLAVLQALHDSGIDPAEARIQTTPHGPHSREMLIGFRPDDQARVDDVAAELERLGLDPHRSADGLAITAGVVDHA